jgi:hypothetical protein
MNIHVVVLQVMTSSYVGVKVSEEQSASSETWLNSNDAT